MRDVVLDLTKPLTPDRRPRWTRRNVLCIDTGVHIEEYGHLTVAEFQTGTPRLHRFARV